MPDLRLRPFERRHLPLAEPWFTDPDTQRWLGGPRWPPQMLDLADRPLGEFRGAVETDGYRWLAWERDTAWGGLPLCPAGSRAHPLTHGAAAPRTIQGARNDHVSA